MERPVKRNEKITALIENMERVIIGKRQVIELVVTAMLAEGHVLIEDVPGVGKTQLVSALAHSCGGVFHRLQLTPDVMPSDVTGFTMVNSADHSMEFRQGAAFCNFLLADEINRASPKSQSALLEIMEENQVSMDGVTHRLPSPFMVLATQNPVETYGTYHLPEAQLDRFLMKLTMGYPGRENELAILRRGEESLPQGLEQVLSCQDILSMIGEAGEVRCSERIEEYIVDIVEATRNAQEIRLGVSPRGSVALHRVSKAYAYVCGRSYVLPDDIKLLAPYVLAHRILLTSGGKAELESPEKAIEHILTKVAVPVT